MALRQEVTETLTLGAAYTYLDATNSDGSVEVRRPRHELALNASLQTFGGRGWIAADLRGQVASLRGTAGGVTVLADSGLTETTIPWGGIVVVLASSAVVGVLASLWPAHRAAKTGPLEAIAD